MPPCIANVTLMGAVLRRRELWQIFADHVYSKQDHVLFVKPSSNLQTICPGRALSITLVNEWHDGEAGCNKPSQSSGGI